MSKGSTPNLSLKVVINKEKSKVLFAEADSDVVDILLSFLTLPLGKIVKILSEHYGDKARVIGSLTTLYNGLVNLDSTHFCVGDAKRMLVDPMSYFHNKCRMLKLNISDSQPVSVSICEVSKCPNFLSMYVDKAESTCREHLKVFDFVDLDHLVKDANGVFVIKGSSFIICDDLRIVPVVVEFLQTLNDLGISGTDEAEIRNLSIEIDDVMDLIMYSLISSNPLTDLVIKKIGKKTSTAARLVPSCFSHHVRNGDAESGNIVLKVILQKSTNKFLLALATYEFMEFLFSFLVVPLGGVEFLLRGETLLNTIDNLYRSVKYLIDNRHFTTPYVKDLMNPRIPYGYIPKNQFFTLSEGSVYVLNLNGEKHELKWSKGEGSFVKKKTTCIVRDDLTVTPFSVTSSFSIINSLGVSLSDVKEKDFQIGVEEALSILKASLSSTTPLSDVLIKPMLKRQLKRPKHEP